MNLVANTLSLKLTTISQYINLTVLNLNILPHLFMHRQYITQKHTHMPNVMSHNIAEKGYHWLLWGIMTLKTKYFSKNIIHPISEYLIVY